jgi:hypothetical protein
MTATGATRSNNPPSAPTIPTTPANIPNVVPPQISELEYSEVGGYQFDLTGYVFDPGNDVGDMTVTFSGAFGLPDGQTSITVPVYPINGSTMFGYFTVTVQLIENTTKYPICYDWSAVASDGIGGVSGQVSCEITLPPELLKP